MSGMGTSSANSIQPPTKLDEYKGVKQFSHSSRSVTNTIGCQTHTSYAQTAGSVQGGEKLV